MKFTPFIVEGVAKGRCLTLCTTCLEGTITNAMERAGHSK